jgi:hypothetical protein
MVLANLWALVASDFVFFVAFVIFVRNPSFLRESVESFALSQRTQRTQRTQTGSLDDLLRSSKESGCGFRAKPQRAQRPAKRPAVDRKCLYRARESQFIGCAQVVGVPPLQIQLAESH